MRAALKAFVLLFGAVCCLIAMAHILIGHAAIPGAAPGFNAVDDSEDRFYATLFLGYGAAMVWAGMDVAARSRLFFWLLVVFFLGGIARIISALHVGLPSPLFQFLATLELVLPPLLWWWHRATLPRT